MDTGTLIERLAEGVAPVRPLPRPLVRTAAWLALAIPYVALVVLAASPRDDLLAKMSEPRFLVEQLAALATAVTAAAAAFATSIPGFDRRIRLLPVLPLAIWLGILAEGCVRDLIRYGILLQPDLICLPSIVIVSAVPAVTMALMLRRGAPLTPFATMALGGLAATALGDFGLRLFHAQDASLMVLVWQFGAVLVLSAFAGWAGRFLLSWRSIVGPTLGKVSIG